jgi:hypothetical protein
MFMKVHEKEDERAPGSVGWAGLVGPVMMQPKQICEEGTKRIEMEGPVGLL